MDCGLMQECGRWGGSYFYHIGDGYQFNIHVFTGSTIYFKCNKSSCQGRALLRLGEQFVHTEPHNHAPDYLYVEVMAARRRIVNEARSLNFVSFAQIIAAERQRIESREVRSHLTVRRLRPAMLRARNEIFPNVPVDLPSLTAILRNAAYAALGLTIDMEDNMYLDSVQAADGSHNVVFMSKRCLDVIRVVPILFADGTFYIAPSILGCYQVFTLVTMHGHTVIPLTWVLMETKSESAYVAVLECLRNHIIQWAFDIVVSDFEDAIRNAFRVVFNIQVQGCLFHSASAMVKHARLTIGIGVLQFNMEVKLIVRLCCSMPLLPPQLLQRGLIVIGLLAMSMGDALYTIVLRPYLEYIQVQWLQHPNRGPALSVCGSDNRTNNASESNNRRMKRVIGVHHPNIFQFIRKLAEFEDVAIDDIHSLAAGIIPSRHRAVQAITNDERVRNLTATLLAVQNPSDEQILVFLYSAASSLDNVINDALA